jgi:VacB/RNase II family 3'-5' exoribonuclease
VPDHRVTGVAGRLDFSALRAEIEVPGDFSSAAMDEATAAAAQPRLPDLDRTDIPFVTVDPAGSRDLDQAVHLAADGDGFLVSYAIADVAAFVRPQSALDEQLQSRGETLYFPDARVPLHPPVLSEGAASLLPGQLRPAVLWQIALDASGQVTRVDLARARIRSRQQLDYGQLQQLLESGTAPAAVELLPRVGATRQKLARQRHAINLDLPEQDVVAVGDGWALRLRQPLPVEAWNAEISLLTGMCAGRIMLDGGYGILRTVPPPSKSAVNELRQIAPALGIEWRHGVSPGDVLSTLRRDEPRQAVFIEHAVALLRGAAYTTFDGPLPAQPLHAGIAAVYAHVTAPLRRLVDRYGTEICLSLTAGESVPQWVRDRLPSLPDTMAVADRRAHVVDRAVVDMTEAWLLRDRVGELFDAVVLDANDHGATIALAEPAVRARCGGRGLRPGEAIKARLVTADVVSRTIRFERT